MTFTEARTSAKHLLDVLPAHEDKLEAALALNVLVPVYNERHLVGASLARLLKLEDPIITRLEVIVVDDHSTDGSWEVLQKIAATDARVQLYRHERNRGKGAAIRTALEHVTGDVCIIHDADMEYNPADIPAILRPFVLEGADAVYGSRYMSAPYRQVLLYRHSLVNKCISFLSNCVTDLNLSDVETCYKAIKTSLLTSIPLRSNDYGFEVEITVKLAKRRARVFEVPIRYLPRTRAEGKKIGARDGVRAIGTLLRFALLDDIYREDEYGSHALTDLQDARRFNQWMGNTLRPYIGDRVLEIGAGVGTLTNQFIPREVYVASDINENYLHYLRSYSIGKPYLRVLRVDAGNAPDFRVMRGQVDTILMVNVLEHVPNERTTLQCLYDTLEPGGRAVILVPQHPLLYGSLDKALEHRERYTAAGLEQSLTQAGFRVERIFDFNRTAVPPWFLNGRILQRKGFSPFQLKVLEVFMPVIKRIDRAWPWGGLSVIGVAIKD